MHTIPYNKLVIYSFLFFCVYQRDTLQSQLSDQRIELDTLKSILPSPSSKPQQNLQGLIQRLVTKEKQVLRLQSEIEGLKSQIEKETQELVSLNLGFFWGKSFDGFIDLFLFLGALEAG